MWLVGVGMSWLRGCSGNVHGAWENDLQALAGMRELVGYLPVRKPQSFSPFSRCRFRNALNMHPPGSELWVDGGWVSASKLTLATKPSLGVFAAERARTFT